jgi:predicted TPR repeat methyltransferase
LAYFGEDIGTMIGLVDRALTLSPNYARGWLMSSSLRLWAGQLDTAIEHLETVDRLSPRARVGPFFAENLRLSNTCTSSMH